MFATKTLAASAVVTAVPGALVGLLITAAADAATVTLYDNATTNSGVVLAVLKAPIQNSVGWYPPPGGQTYANGIYATITGTSPSITVLYR